MHAAAAPAEIPAGARENRKEQDFFFANYPPKLSRRVDAQHATASGLARALCQAVDSGSSRTRPCCHQTPHTQKAAPTTAMTEPLSTSP